MGDQTSFIPRTARKKPGFISTSVFATVRRFVARSRACMGRSARVRPKKRDGWRFSKGAGLSRAVAGSFVSGWPRRCWDGRKFGEHHRTALGGWRQSWLTAQFISTSLTFYRQSASSCSALYRRCKCLSCAGGFMWGAWRHTAGWYALRFPSSNVRTTSSRVFHEQFVNASGRII